MRTCHQRPAVDKTWINFKTCFEDDHNILCRVRGATMKNTAFHQENILATQVLEEVKDVKAMVWEAFQELYLRDNNTSKKNTNLRKKK